jgi:hypothetical protein
MFQPMLPSSGVKATGWGNCCLLLLLMLLIYKFRWCTCVSVTCINSSIRLHICEVFYLSCKYLFVYLHGLVGCILFCWVVCRVSRFRMLDDWDSWQYLVVLFAVCQLQPWGICGVFAVPTNTLLLNILPAQRLGKSSGGVRAQCNSAWFYHAYSREFRAGSHISAWVVIR